MKTAYPIILTPADTGYMVTVPDLQINTEGADIADAIEMAEDAIGLWGIAAQDMGKGIPTPSAESVRCREGEIAAFAVVDFEAYRRANDLRTIRKNVTLPSYLNDMAERAGLNFSRVLQDALKEKLQVHGSP